MFRGTRHLIRSGHKSIGILLEDCDLLNCQERLAGYQRALEEYKVPFDKKLVCRVNLYRQEEENIFDKARFDTLPSAFIASGNTLTLKLLKNADDYGLKCPDDISIVGFGDDEWSGIFNPSLTILRQDTAGTAKRAVEVMMKIMKGNPIAPTVVRMPIGFTVRKSTRVINRGPFGEIAVPPEAILVDTAEEEYLKKGQFKVAIAFHCMDTEWSRLQEMAIRDTLARYNVQVVAVMDANFNAQLQVTQLDALRMQKPDAIIGVPVDENITAGKFKELSRLTKMILIGNIPQGIDQNDYYSCVSVNERENGQNAGNILGEYFKERTHIKLGLLNHGLPFHMTRQRDNAAEQVLTENYTNLQIVSRKNFYQIQNVYDTCLQMMREHPEISGLYVSWERPAMEAIRALRALGRTDVAISTVDLDLEIAAYMARGEMVRGISAQRPYEQGEAAAMITIQALLGKKGYKFVGVQPVVVYPRELTRYWREIIRKPAPEFLKLHKSH
ncbi:substrate-binding domain-containing protein [Christensenella sp. NSJ-35]|uniref:Substrate-binding domain-containing protein n=2 Tax=Christensenella tenuis TaxID=2763033 RepID=A0ABR7EEC6_9FIRM|nr:substrate-binding domain-containing protein [Christensenella tenuis]